MGFSISHEVFVLLYSTLAGVSIAFVFDLFKILRKKASSDALFSGIQDFMFWLVAIVIMFFAVFAANNGRLRFYQFFGAFSGAILYFLLLSRWINLVLSRFIDIFFKIFSFFLKILLTPFKFTYNILYVLLSAIVSPFLRMLKMLFKKASRKAGVSLKKARLILKKK